MEKTISSQMDVQTQILNSTNRIASPKVCYRSLNFLSPTKQKTVNKLIDYVQNQSMIIPLI